MESAPIFVIRHSSAIRAVGVEEVRRALESAGRGGVLTEHPVDTAQYAADVEGGYWDASDAYLRRVAGEIKEAADQLGTVEMHYFGLAEIPHVIALGAYIGDERYVHVHDYDRDRDSWAWPATEKTLEVESRGLPRERVVQSGPVVARIDISSAIADEDVDQAVGSERLADIRIRPAGDRAPARGIVRSTADVETIRLAFREAMAAIADARPGCEVIHLFVATPVSVCFVLGQELHLRSGWDVQTYRHRSREGEPSYRAAIRLAPGRPAATAAPLSEAEVDLARHLRTVVWQRALDAVIQYALSKRDETGSDVGVWYEYLQPRDAVSLAAPFPGLRPIWEMVDERDTIAPEPREVDYGFDKDVRAWRLSDRLLLGLFRAAGTDERKMEELIRLFLFHEYLHDVQVLTKYTAEDVGSFANCLERIDYMADTYALLHQLDFALRNERKRVQSEVQKREFLGEQIDIAIRSFWAFEPPPPHYRWQERRLRRYLNWFWRRVQVLRAPDLLTALRTLSRPPAIEVAGLQYVTGRGRIFVRLDQYHRDGGLEIGIVLEDGRFWRARSAGNMSIEAAMEAFARQDHEELVLFFNSLFENVRATGGEFPPEP